MFLMRKLYRGADIGRGLALWVKDTMNSLPENQGTAYRDNFITELKKYSFIPKRKGEPPNAGCVYELEDIIANFNPADPEHTAKLCKEIAHWRYSKPAAASMLKSLLDNLADEG